MAFVDVMRFVGSIFSWMQAGGTGTLGLSAQSPNMALLGPASGTTSLAPAFRALVSLDLGLTTTGDLLYNNGGTLTPCHTTSNGQVLTLIAGLPGWAALPAGFAQTLLGGVSGSLSLASANTLTLAGAVLSGTSSNGTLTLQNADSTHTGLLTSSDWSTFNGKQGTITGTTALSLGTLTASGTITAGGLSATNLTAGSVLFAGTSGVVTQDNDNLYWDPVNKRLAVGYSPPTGNFVGLSQTARNWWGIAAAPNGDVYACASTSGIFKQTGGTGNFVDLLQTSRSWQGVTVAPNGDAYACVTGGGDIYKQTGGTGNFVALSQTSRFWTAMAAAPNGDVYACPDFGDIYKQTGGTGNFVALSQTLRNWSGLTALPNGDVYASVLGGDIYKQTGGTGNFIAQGQTSRHWYGIGAAPNGDIYACENFGGAQDIYKKAATHIPPSASAKIHIRADLVADILLMAQRMLGQTGDLTQWLDETGTATLGKVDANGNLIMAGTGSNSIAGSLTISKNITGNGTGNSSINSGGTLTTGTLTPSAIFAGGTLGVTGSLALAGGGYLLVQKGVIVGAG